MFIWLCQVFVSVQRSLILQRWGSFLVGGMQDLLPWPGIDWSSAPCIGSIVLATGPPGKPLISFYIMIDLQYCVSFKYTAKWFIFTYIHFVFRFFSHIGYYRILSRVPWAIPRSLLITYFMYSRFEYGVTVNTYLFAVLVLAVLSLRCAVWASL